MPSSDAAGCLRTAARRAFCKQTDENDGVIGQVLRRRPEGRRGPRCRGRAAPPPDRYPARIRNAGEWMPPSADDDLAAEKFLLARRRSSAATPIARPTVEQQAGDRGVGENSEIAAAAHVGGEIADRRRRALVRPVAHRHAAIAVAEVGIHVGDEAEFAVLARKRAPPSTAAPNPLPWCGGSAPARPCRAARRRNRDRFRACGNRAARRPSPSRRRRALATRRNRRACRDRRPCPSRSSRRRACGLGKIRLSGELSLRRQCTFRSGQK